MVDDEQLPCEFSGFALEYTNKNVLIQHKGHYLKKLETMDDIEDQPYKIFRSTRMKLAWLAKIRTDCLFEISQLSQVTEEFFNKIPTEWIKKNNRTVIYARDYNSKSCFINFKMKAFFSLHIR